MDESGLKPSTLAEKMGRKRPFVSRMLRGNYKPNEKMELIRFVARRLWPMWPMFAYGVIAMIGYLRAMWLVWHWHGPALTWAVLGALGGAGVEIRGKRLESTQEEAVNDAST